MHRSLPQIINQDSCLDSCVRFVSPVMTTSAGAHRHVALFKAAQVAPAARIINVSTVDCF